MKCSLTLPGNHHPEQGEITYLVNNTVDTVNHQYYSILFDNPFASAPAFLADMQTYDGDNTANVRYTNKDKFAVDVFIDEEQSKDTETGHILEGLGYMAFSH